MMRDYSSCLDEIIQGTPSPHTEMLISDGMRHTIKVRRVKLKMVTYGALAKQTVICNP